MLGCLQPGPDHSRAPRVQRGRRGEEPRSRTRRDGGLEGEPPRGPVGTRCPSTRTCTASTRPGPAHLRGHPARKPQGLAPAVLPPGGTGRRLGTSVVVTLGRGQGCRSAPRSVQDGPAEDDRWPRGPCSDLCGNVHAVRTAHAGPWGARARAGVRFRAPPAPSGAAQTGASPALRVSVGFGRGRGGRERRRVPAAEWHLVTVTSPFVCRLNRSLGGYI